MGPSETVYVYTFSVFFVLENIENLLLETCCIMCGLDKVSITLTNM